VPEKTGSNKDVRALVLDVNFLATLLGISNSK